MRPRTSPAYWPMRILLAIGLVSVAVIVAWGVVTLILAVPYLAILEVGPVSVDPRVITVAVAVAVPLVGLAWMIRDFRGMRDEQPAWRHRDR